MKIVVLDGHALNPGDLSWDGLRKLGECQVYDRTMAADTLQRCQDAHIAITNKVIFDRTTIAALPTLKCIGVTATGYNIIDVAAAAEHGVIVTNVPTYSTRSVAQMVFALLLELAQHVGDHAQSVRAGRWSRSADFCYWDKALMEVDGLTMGIVGYGKIGRAAAALAKAFGMAVIAYTPRIRQEDAESVEFVDLNTLLARADVISLHCPLTDENEGMINADRLQQMKKTAFLINTGRGGLVNEAHLAAALDHGEIAGAGLDVLSAEPPPPDNPLLTARNCYVTPHIAWASVAARTRLLNTVEDNVRAFIKGKPQNVVG